MEETSLQVYQKGEILNLNKSENNCKTKKVYLEILRVIACLLVVLIHTAAKYEGVDFINTSDFWIGSFFCEITRIAVPLFVMISGSLLLDKNYNYSKSKLIKHIKRFVIFFLFWSIIYSTVHKLLIQVFMHHEAFSIKDYIFAILEGHYHLWFIYMIIGVYLLLPLLRLWVKEKNIKYIRYFILLSLIFNCILPHLINIGKIYNENFNSFQNIVDDINLKYVCGFTTYFILGWYFNNYDVKHKKTLYFLGILSIFILIIERGIITTTTNNYYNEYKNLMPTILIYSSAVFVYIKEKFKDTNKENKIIKKISENSLGIYAIHPLMLTIFSKILFDKVRVNAFINIGVLYSIALSFSFIITSILKKIPILKKIV